MASLRQELRYGLSCGKTTKSSPNITLYHVKLTDTAVRALEAYQNLKGALQSQPSICFKGNQGCIKIPAEPAPALRLFSFYLSSDSKDQPQASFDCIHQYVSSDGREQLDAQGSIQDKITVCATDDSYQVTRERMSQVEKDSWSRSAIEIKPGATHPSKCVKYHKRPAPASASEGHFYKPATSSRRMDGPTALSQKPLKERVVHLLALKPYRKPELLLWLERERAGPKDKAELSAVLEEVAKLNPKDSSYLLKDDLYREVQRDWPGYGEEDKQLIGRLLARKLQPHISSQPRNAEAHVAVAKISEDQSIAKNIYVKRPMPFDSQDRLAVKRQKLMDLRSQHQPVEKGLVNGKGAQNSATPTPGPGFQSNPEPERTHERTDPRCGPPASHGAFPLLHQLHSLPDGPVPERREPESKTNDPQPPPCDSERAQQHLANSQHRKKKSKRHKERERLKDDKDTEWLKSSPDLKQNPDKADNPDITTAVASEEKPDYVLSYSPVTSAEQRRRYQEDFCAEYDEYKDLHSRIAAITHIFVQLGSKIKSLSPGTREYKIMEDQILEKYKKYRKKFPSYREEKKRCEYLHEKLSYIKQLIADYDLSKASS
ncbi:RNA polymerase II elongation factor ELL2 [Kryptolebias marmoratus]|uniref:RNA polymerase II elongation factor ELL2 n=1 Tax=Kryptolebias marmoratus TaxID=37003 RepID=A0A3Q3B248_KRYMA|nr:RNA polymerase II elongation factor ELL2 [Kryptolebias marmoratus]